MMKKSQSPSVSNELSHLSEQIWLAAAKSKYRPLPNEKRVTQAMEGTREMLFPGSTGSDGLDSEEDTKKYVQEVLYEWVALIQVALRSENPNVEKNEAKELAKHPFSSLLDIREILRADISATLRGDPAAMTEENIILSYPGIRALTSHRVAHLLYKKEIPLLPRQITEHAHRETGIDIHPGAHIEKGFCIDHGTGIVIGETTRIGENVRLYQGVTLGASTDPVKAGRTQRHPMLGNNVTCFAGSGVFGPITIGNNVTIGAGAEVFEDIAANHIVLSPKTELIKREKKK